MHRPAGYPPKEIMQRNLDRRLGAVVGIHAPIHGLHGASNVSNVAAHQHRRQIVNRRDHARDRFAGHGRRRGGFAPSDKAIVGFDTHQHIVRAAHLFARHDQRLDHGQADGERLDCFDGHRSTTS